MTIDSETASGPSTPTSWNALNWLSNNWLKVLGGGVIGTMVLIGILQALGWWILPIALVVGGLVSIFYFKVPHIGWTLITIGVGVAGILAVILLFHVGTPPVDTTSSGTQTTPSMQEHASVSENAWSWEWFIQFIGNHPLIWQLGLVLTGFLAGEFFINKLEMKIFGWVLIGVSAATGLYVLLTVSSIEWNVIGTWVTWTFVHAQHLDVRSIWQTITDPELPKGEIIAVTSIVLVLIGSLWVKGYRWIVGSIAAIVFIFMVGYYSIKALPDDAKQWIEDTNLSVYAEASTSPTIESAPATSKPRVSSAAITPGYIDQNNEIQLVWQVDHGTHITLDGTWRKLPIAEGYCVESDKNPPAIEFIPDRADLTWIRSTRGVLDVIFTVRETGTCS